VKRVMIVMLMALKSAHVGGCGTDEKTVVGATVALLRMQHAMGAKCLMPIYESIFSFNTKVRIAWPSTEGPLSECGAFQINGSAKDLCEFRVTSGVTRSHKGTIATPSTERSSSFRPRPCLDPSQRKESWTFEEYIKYVESFGVPVANGQLFSAHQVRGWGAPPSTIPLLGGRPDDLSEAFRQHLHPDQLLMSAGPHRSAAGRRQNALHPQGRGLGLCRLGAGRRASQGPHGLSYLDRGPYWLQMLTDSSRRD
jgi:hypothetical protein